MSTPIKPYAKRVQMDCKRLADEVGKRRVLWDVKHPQHCNRRTLETKWDEVADLMEHSRIICRKKWKYLKDQYRKEIRMELKVGKRFTSNWSIYPHMAFLKDYFMDTQSSWALENVDTESCQDQEEQYENEDSIEIASTVSGEQDSDLLDDMDVDVIELGPLSPLKRQAEEAHVNAPHAKHQALFPQTSGAHHITDSDIDTDLFFKSLLPYMRHFSLLQKLRLRNSIQTAIFKELEWLQNGNNTDEPPPTTFDKGEPETGSVVGVDIKPERI